MLRALFSKHYLALILALFVGVTTFIPNLERQHNLGDSFTGLYANTCCTDEIYYRARAQDVLDGHPTLSNPYLAEYKEGPALQFWIPDAITAGSAVMFGGDYEYSYRFYDFLLPAVLFLLSYAVLIRLTKSKELSLATSILLHIGIYFNLFTRPISPQFNFIFFLLFMLAYLAFVESGSKKHLIYTVLALGALFHVYTYYWTYAFVFIGLYTCFQFLFGLESFKKAFARGSAIIVGGTLIGLPYILQSIESLQLPHYTESLERLGLLHTRIPSGFAVVFWAGVLTLALLASYRLRFIKKDATSVFLLAAVLATAVAMNHHIVTGTYLEFTSHYGQLSVFVFFFTGAYLLSALMRENQYRLHFGYVLIAIAVLFSTPHLGKAIVHQSAPTEREFAWQRYGDVFSWLNENTEKDSVVYADNEITRVLAGYTHNNIFWGDAALLHFFPTEEALDRFAINNYFNDAIQTWDTDDFIKAERRIWGTPYVNSYLKETSANRFRRILGREEVVVPRLPETAIEDMRERHQSVQAQSFTATIANYQVHYIIWDRLRNPEYAIDEEKSIEKVFEKDNIIIYSLSSDF